VANIGVIVGSLSSTSINQKLVEACKPLAEQMGLSLTDISIKDLPLFSQDLEADFPAAAVEFKNQIEASDGLIIVTPEYNRSIPGGLKNAIDWGSRPWGKSSFAGKKVAVAGMGGLGAALAQRHLRDVLSFLDTQVMGQPEVYAMLRADYFAEDGSFVADADKAFFTQWLETFKNFLAK
jgi:chromate reductase